MRREWSGNKNKERIGAGHESNDTIQPSSSMFEGASGNTFGAGGTFNNAGRDISELALWQCTPVSTNFS